MSDSKKYYCFCGSNCKYETMTKEQILAAIAQAVETGSIGDVDAGFITKVKEQNGGRAVTFWVGTQAQYNALESIAENCLYIITDDTLRADMEKCIAETQAAVEEMQADIADMITVDIKDKISFVCETALPAGCTANIRPLWAKYNKGAGIVFFTFSFTCNGYTTEQGKTIATFMHTGGYAPVGRRAACVTTTDQRVFAKYGELIDMGAAHIVLEATEQFTQNGLDIIVSGWYFCDGE